MLSYMRDEEGVTLLEIILASALITIALLSLSGAFTAGLLSDADVGHMTTALYLAQAKLEEIKNLPYADISSEESVNVPGFPLFQWKVEASEYQKDLKRVRVTVVWWSGVKLPSPLPGVESVETVWRGWKWGWIESKKGKPSAPVEEWEELEGQVVELETLIANY